MYYKGEITYLSEDLRESKKFQGFSKSPRGIVRRTWKPDGNEKINHAMPKSCVSSLQSISSMKSTVE